MSAAETKPAPLDDDRLWTAHDVARYMSASLVWVRRATAAGRLPCIRIGAMVRYDPETIRAWVKGGAGKVLPIRR